MISDGKHISGRRYAKVFDNRSKSFWRWGSCTCNCFVKNWLVVLWETACWNANDWRIHVKTSSLIFQLRILVIINRKCFQPTWLDFNSAYLLKRDALVKFTSDLSDLSRFIHPPLSWPSIKSIIMTQLSYVVQIVRKLDNSSMEA